VAEFALYILRHRAIRFGIVLLVFACVPLYSQNKSGNNEEPDKRQSSYRVRVNAVLVKAIVTDKKGNPVTDLTSNDFRVYDDGKPQEIQTFALESFGSPEAEATKAPEEKTPSPAPEHSNARPRMISIIIDDLTMESVQEFPRIVDAVKKFIKTDMGATDQVSIMSGSRKVGLPFSNNKQQLLEALDSVPRNLNVNKTLRSCPEITDLEAVNISGLTHHSLYYYRLIFECNGMEAPPEGGIVHADGNTLSKEEEWVNHAAIRTKEDSEFRTRGLLDTLRQHIRTLTHFEGPKTVVLFSDGFLSQSRTAESYRMQELVNMALRSGIILNTVSIRGVNNVSADDLYNSAKQWKISMQEDNKQAQHMPLAQLAEETGGIFSQGNSMYNPLETIANRQFSYYILTYGMPPHKADGAYHNIRLELTRPGLKLSYRKGYYVPKEELTYENTKKEDLMDALSAPGNMNEIPMSLSYNYSQDDDSNYAVSFVTTVNIRDLHFQEEDSRRKNQVSLVLVAFDETDRYISGLEKAIEFQLLENSYANLRNRGLTSRVELKLPAGRYKVKAVVREGNQGKMGSISKAVQIP
jgi:VWFA-related protein